MKPKNYLNKIMKGLSGATVETSQNQLLQVNTMQKKTVLKESQ